MLTPPSPNGPSSLLSQQIITLEIPNGFQNVYRYSIFKDSKISYELSETYIHWNQQTWFWLNCRFTGLWLYMPVERLSPKVGSIPAYHSVQQNINSLLKYFPYVYMHLSEQNRVNRYSLFSFWSYKDIRGISIKYNTNGYGMTNFLTLYIYSFLFPDMEQWHFWWGGGVVNWPFV